MKAQRLVLLGAITLMLLTSVAIVPAENSGEPTDRVCGEGLTRPTENQYGRCYENYEVCVDGKWDSAAGNYIPAGEICDDLDNDCDGLTDEDCDMLCSRTPDEFNLGTNRWMWDGTAWVTNLPNGKGPELSFTIEQTHDCSCTEILNWLQIKYPEEYGEMQGHYKFGCSISIMQDSIALIQIQQPE